MYSVSNERRKEEGWKKKPKKKHPTLDSVNTQKALEKKKIH